eukprot:Blabericola_migrator_1__4243@NODE_22_length_22262_cov_139_742014_g19_i0_p1_GENE_NODE_22_length_22262_cov_139_742014_g19_i0NODE_22_length_22262_cov_139_742014_g19_i0_p1_ORF_typecomplete_len852_score163_63Flavi_DEAD/PF07652_14/0_4Flavi_DEAD/PF07652_14/7_6e13HA2/PF04408_23/2_6e13HA2/PF04408_23/4_2e03DEAD/PF00270_29/6_1e13Helicase_C/PF00271_31/1_7e10Helicase_C/PF00271_31/7_7e03AAA_19/PF13245_6/1_5e06AAA_19/PF13245_6/1_3e04AAA_22/PF13401_6/1_1e05AAA_22/PF13401_6/8_8e03AAA_30/PF13604_6/0_00083TniB/PF0
MAALPIAEHKAKLLELVEHHVVTVVSGETGCGKTTQIPQYLRDSPRLKQLVKLWDKEGWRQDEVDAAYEGPKVLIVQPHRIAAIAMARRVAEERGAVLGEEVGYTVRWDSVADKRRTRIRYVTDGTLVKECTDGRGLTKMTDFLVIDEAHERSLNIDVLLALIKREIKRLRSDKRRYPRVEDIPIRFVITSATLDVAKFCKFFNDCPLLTVPGRLYPVKCIHVPVKIAGQEDDKETPNPTEGIVIQPGAEIDLSDARRNRRKRLESAWLSPEAALTAAVTIAMRIHTETPVATGHILAFLSGAAECDRAVKEMHQKLQDAVDAEELNTGQPSEIPSCAVIPLYGSLDAHQQAAVFVEVPPDTRKVIFATNVAETSLTIGGVGHIVDCGIVKQTFYQPRSGLVALNRVPVSKTQARQRAGRAGRTRDGTCWRLYSEETFAELDEHTIPEILRTDPSAAVLSLLAMNITDILSLEFIDTPNKLSVALALRELATLGAIDPDTLLVTDVGKAMSQTPLDPIYGRCFVASLHYDVVEEVAGILGLLSSEQVFTTPNLSSFQVDGDQKPMTLYDFYATRLKGFRDSDSDHMTLLKLMFEWEKRRGYASKLMKKDELYDWCWDHSISMRALLTAEKIKKQLIDVMPDIEELVGEVPAAFLRVRMKMNRKERVLRALCEGLFLNCAKIHLVKSMHVGLKVKGWTSVREGVVVRPAAQSVLSDYMETGGPLREKPRRSDPPTWILYDQLVSLGQNAGSTATGGVVRVASAVDYQWVKDLLPRLYKISLDMLMETVERPRKRKASRRFDEPSSTSQLMKIAATAAVSAPHLGEVKESTHEERQAKLEEAKRRLKERRGGV